MTSNQIKFEKKAHFGIQGLDDILCGGLPINHVYLLEGSPGSGKTTLALQFLLEGVKNNEVGLYITLSESKDELIKVASSHGWSLKNISLSEIASQEVDALPDGQYTFFHPSEVELENTTQNLISEVDKLRPSRVVFDSLSEIRLLARDPLKFRHQILLLKQFFLKRDCTVLLLDDLTSAQGDLQPQSLVHGVVTLEHLAPEYGAERRRLRVLKLRGSRFRGGYHDFIIETGGIVVYPRLVASEHKVVKREELLKSGVEGIDALVCGGIERGSSVLIVGPAGSGKSTLASYYAFAAAIQGEKAALFLFDERVDSILKRTESLGMNFTSYIENKTLFLRQIDPAEMPPGKFVHAVRRAVEIEKVSVVVIDSLNGYLNAMPEERFLTLHLHELLTYLNQMGVITFLIVAQHGLIGTSVDVSTGINVSYLSDIVFLLRYFESEGTICKAISVVKKRTGRHEDTIREFVFKNGKGIEVCAPLRQFSGVLTRAPKKTKTKKHFNKRTTRK